MDRPDYSGDYRHLEHLSVDELLTQALSMDSNMRDHSTMVRAALARVTNASEMDYFTARSVHHILNTANENIVRPDWEELGLEDFPVFQTLAGMTIVKMLVKSFLFAAGPNVTMNRNIESVTDEFGEEYDHNRTALMREMYQEAARAGAVTIGGYIIGAPIAELEPAETEDAITVASALANLAMSGKLLVHRWGMDQHGNEFDIKNRLRLVKGRLLLEGTALTESEITDYAPPFMDYNPWRESFDGTSVSA